MKLPSSYYNPLSFLGSILAGICLALILFLYTISLIFDVGSSYTGLFIYIVLPVLLVIGLVLIPIGMMRKARKSKKIEQKSKNTWMSIDLNNRYHWNALIVFTIGTFIFLFLTGIGSYEAFHYTESNEFCGKLCHTVMTPEYVAYNNSPHARVTCVECHVGEGADWYVKSKLSGLYQVYSVLFNKYHRPIETPLENLRPARETCEKCHWPNKFYSYRLRHEKHYLADESNSEWNIHLKMKIGASHSAEGLKEGIHWHINPNIKVEYIASTPGREYIPWVRYINFATGDTIIYHDADEPLDAETIQESTPRVMDCIDCHNRPSHHFLAPQDFVDFALASGEIPVNLPEIKKLSMDIFNNAFKHPDTALVMMEKQVYDFYLENYPDIYVKQKELLAKAIEGIQSGFKKNIFPSMKASWDTYPTHIGHTEFNGCFRCHNGTHASKGEQVISKDCDACHTILIQGLKDSLEVAPLNNSLEFRHPVDIDKAWKDYNCTDCHRYLYI